MKNTVITFLCCCLLLSAGLAEALVPINPESSALVDRGWALENQGKYDEALSLYDQALGIDPQNYVAYKHRGTTFSRMKNYEQAEIEFTKSIAIEPNHESTYYNRGIMYYEQGAYGKAISDYSKAIELNPNYTSAINNRAAAYAQKEAAARGQVVYPHYARSSPDHNDAYPKRTKLQNRVQAMRLFMYMFFFILILMRFSGMRFGAPPPAAPPLADSQQDEIKKVFLVRQKKQKLISYMIFLLFPFIVFKDLYKINPEHFQYVLMGLVVYILFCLFLVFQNWRCPWCNKYLGKKINLITCPHCGVSLV